LSGPFAEESEAAAESTAANGALSQPGASHPVVVAAQIVLGVAYPFLIWTGLSRFEPRVLGVFVLAFFALRFGLQRPSHAFAAARALLLPAVTVGLVISAVLVWNDPLGLLLMPVAISLGFLVAFLASLRAEQPMVERFARIQVKDLTPSEVVYCRSVTWVWCGFFVLNAAIATTLAATGRIDAWAFYTGFANYILMGMLFAGEYVYRHARFRRYLGGFADPVLMHFFPPRVDVGSMSPVLQMRTREEAGWRVEWLVPKRLDCWPGHFPEQSLLPGVLQLEWILREIESELAGRIKFDRIDRLKFKQPIFPGDRLTLSIESVAKSPEIDSRIELSVRGETATSARVHGRVDPGSAGGGSAADESVASAKSKSRPQANANASSPFPAPSLLLPHGAPMRWIDEVVFHEGDETRCRVRLGALSGFSVQVGPTEKSQMGAWVAIEWMAQCVAAHDGMERYRSSLPIRPGMLLGTQRFELTPDDFAEGESLIVSAIRVFGGDTGMVAYECRVEEEGSGRLRGSARLSCRVGVPGAPLV
jgi:uncharacterized membrane protein/predicted hotdog family 3-hydroxylacyl-ACP dehydratase/3-hydroxymyristoyl/3-hydroxydecanoyl-(acyl carrier protein) dehydratase